MKKSIGKNKMLQKFKKFACDATQLHSIRGGCCGSGELGDSPPVPPKNTQASNGS